MPKPFFYRIDAAEFVAEVLQIPPGKHKEWVVQFALDLVSGIPNGKYSERLINEVADFRAKQAISGRKGGKSKAKRPFSEP